MTTKAEQKRIEALVRKLSKKVEREKEQNIRKKGSVGEEKKMIDDALAAGDAHKIFKEGKKGFDPKSNE